MRTDSKDYSVSDELERRLVQQTPRNRQIPQQRNCGPSNARKRLLESFELIHGLLKDVLHPKSGIDSGAH